MSNTNATAPMKINNEFRIFATNKSLSGRISATMLSKLAPGLGGKCLATASSSAKACCRETEGRSLPTTGRV